MKLLSILMGLGLACLLVSACSEKPPTTVGQTDQGSAEKKPIPIAQVEESETRAMSQERHRERLDRPKSTEC